MNRWVTGPAIDDTATIEPPPVRREIRNGVLDGEKRAGEIGADDAVPVVQLREMDRATGPETGVGHHQREPTQFGGTRAGSAHTVLVGDVARHRVHLRSAFGDGPELVGRYCQAVGVARGQQHRRAIDHQFASTAKTDPRASTGDEGHLAGKGMGITCGRHVRILSPSSAVNRLRSARRRQRLLHRRSVALVR